ncbi:MAG: phage protease, partial [Rhizobiaceae bacterium]
MLVLPAGTLRPRDGRGPFVAGGLVDLKGIIDRTNLRLGATELMVDYDHQAHFGAVSGVGGRAPAAGWAKAFRATPEGIQARIEWTVAAKAAITAGEYRYLSPLFTTDAKHRVDVLLNIALVNMPAIDLQAVAARANQESDMDKFAKAAGLAADAGEDAILARITALAQISTAAITALGLATDADDAAVRTA